MKTRMIYVNKRYMLPLFCTFLCWGSLYVVSKVALLTIPPVTLLLLRYLVAVPTLLVLLKIRGVLKPLKKEDFGTIFAIGFTGYFFSFCLQMLGINRLSGSVSSLLGAMNPIFIPILAALFLHERLTVSKVLCVLVSMTGVVVIVGVSGTADPVGAALMLASVALWSTASIIIRRLGGRYDPMQIAMMAITCAIPLTGVWSAIELQSQAISFPAASVLAVLFMGTIGTAAPHSLWNYCLSKMDASFCSMFYPLQPLVASTLGVLFLGERVTANYVLGALIICCGIVAAVATGKKKTVKNV